MLLCVLFDFEINMFVNMFVALVGSPQWWKYDMAQGRSPFEYFIPLLNHTVVTRVSTFLEVRMRLGSIG